MLIQIKNYDRDVDQQENICMGFQLIVHMYANNINLWRGYHLIKCINK